MKFSQMPYERLDRKELLKMLEPLGRFKIWEDDVDFVAFFDDDGAVSGAPGEVLTASYRRPGEVLAIFGNTIDRTVEFDIRLDGAKLKLPREVSFSDGETGENVRSGHVTLPPYDVRIIRIGNGK